MLYLSQLICNLYFCIIFYYATKFYQMKTVFYYLNLTMLLLVAFAVYADNGILYKSDKMSSSLLNCICQDSHGYIWVGTEYGLNKFDGYHFTNYFYDKNDTTSISNDIITFLFVDGKSDLWVGTAKGLVKYDYHHNNFKRYQLPNNTGAHIGAIIENSEGDIVIGTAGRGLYSVRKGTDIVVKEDEIAHNIGFFTRLFEDDEHYMWRGSQKQEFSRYRIKKHKTVDLQVFKSAYGPVAKFLKYNKQSFLIVCLNGIYKYEYSTGKVSDAGYDLKSLGTNNAIHNAMFDHRGNLYLSTSDKGVMKIAASDRRACQMESDIIKFRLDMADVHSVFEDKDNNLWICCYNKGLYQINQMNSSFRSWNFTNHKYSIDNNVLSIIKGDSGDTWCVVSHNGVYKFDKSGNIISHPASPQGTKLIYRDRTGKYWLCADKVLYSYHPDDGSYKPELTLDGWGINSIVDDGKGTLYISNYGKGLCVFDTKTKNMQNFLMDMQLPKGTVCNDWIMSMYIDRKGLLWISTSDGISCMNTKDNNFRVLGWTGAIRNTQCNAIGELSDKNMIIGTYDGIYIYDRKKNRVIPFPGSDKVNIRKICSIVEDKDGDIWFSTAMGIWQYQKKNKTFVSHINGNGLISREYILGAAFHRGDDLIGFGTNDGITVFYPKDVKSNHLKMGQVYLTGFNLDGKQLDCSLDEFVLPYDENTFSMDFSLLNYKNTDNIIFQYKINNSDWISTEEGNNRIFFNRLKPGSYTIKVRAVNNGTYSSGLKVITLIVEDPWYLSSLAILLYCIIFTIVLFFVSLYYKRKRTVEMEDTKLRFLINATHDIRSPLTLILGPLHKLKTRLTDDDSKADIETIDRNANRLLLLVSQILDQRKIDKHEMRLHCMNTDIVKFINDICGLYLYNAKNRNITFRFLHTEHELNAWIDRMNFDKVICNLLSNAFKYTNDGGCIDITLERKEECFEITVEDDGIGFNEINPDKLFDMFYQGRNSALMHIEGTGIGLNITRSIVEMHGGRITAQKRTNGGKGARFVISIPLGNNHLSQDEIEANNEFETTNVVRKSDLSIKILIADDDPEISQYIKKELGGYYRFGMARNGEAALSMLLEEKYDLIISDIMMPEMDGITLLKMVKTNRKISDIPVILLTSKSEVNNRLNSYRRGADAFLAKPFDMEELHILIENLISNVRRLRGKYLNNSEEKIDHIEVKGYDDMLMERIVTSINENMSNKEFNVQMLCEQVGVSRTQLHRKMKEITGISTIDYIRNVRMEQAARLLKENKSNISEIAYAVGFANQAHFSTTFKKHFGMTPKDYADA